MNNTNYTILGLNLAKQYLSLCADPWRLPKWQSAEFERILGIVGSQLGWKLWEIDEKRK